MAVRSSLKRLNDLVKEVHALKEQAKILKKREAELKQLLEANALEEQVVDDIKVTYKEFSKSEVSEDKLIAIISDIEKASDPQDAKLIASALTTKIVVNEDQLQHLIYQGIISAEDLSAAYTEKVSKRLTVKQIAKK